MTTPTPGGWDWTVRLVCADVVSWSIPEKLLRSLGNSEKATGKHHINQEACFPLGMVNQLPFRPGLPVWCECACVLQGKAFHSSRYMPPDVNVLYL